MNSKFKEMFGQTIKNLTPIITEQAEAQAQGEISGGGGGEIKFWVWTILISVLDSSWCKCFVMTNTHKSIDMLTMI